jgi:hypothetical protein
MPLFMIVIHGTAAFGTAPYYPMTWQAAPFPGVIIHGAWVSSVGSIGAGKPADTRSFELIECEAGAPLSGYVNAVSSLCPQIEIHEVHDFLPLLLAAAARDPEQRPRRPDVSDEERQATTALIRRYMSAATPEDAVEVWMTSEPPGGAGMVRDAELRARVNQEHAPETRRGVNPGEDFT